MNAESREAVFAELRKQGIKAIKVVAADGSKANGEIRGVRKRVVAAVAVVAAVIAACAAFFLGESNSRADGRLNGSVASSRHQIYGDPVILAQFEQGQLDDLLPRPGDRLLAWFAVPGKLMIPKGVDPRRPTAESQAAFAVLMPVQPWETFA